MNKQGVALIFSLLVVIILSILLGSFFLSSMSENSSVKRYVNSARAFWAAEAGLAAAVKDLPNNISDTHLDNYSHYQANTAFRATINTTDYYDINSTGIIALPSGGYVNRTVNAVAKSEVASNPDKFQYALHAANNICFSGNCDDGKADRYIVPLTCNNHTCWKDSDANINSRDMFGYELSEISAIATHYTDSNFPGAVSGVTWVDVTGGGSLHLSGNTAGSGILIINGNTDIQGTYDFSGIIYVLGTFVAARGDFTAQGSVVVANAAGVDDVSGSAEFRFNATAIQIAIGNLPAKKEIVSWRETP